MKSWLSNGDLVESVVIKNSDGVIIDDFFSSGSISGTFTLEEINGKLVSGTVIGATQDAGSVYTATRTSGSSADITTAIDITGAPESGKKVVVDDILVSSGSALLLTFQEETTNTVLLREKITADTGIHICTRAKFKLDTADKKLKMKADQTGNVYYTVFWHSET